MFSQFVGAFVALAAGGACSRDQAPAPAPTVVTNVLIVTIDTLRADRVGIYGAAGVATPNIDQLARDGAWAPQATVHAPLTRPSHVSLFTGRYPAEHGIRDNVSPTLGPDVPLLAGLFDQQGFATAAFVASVVLDRQSGLSRGFGNYSDRFGPGADRRSGDEVCAEALQWLKGKTRFFAWVHLYDLHAPYAPPSRYAVQYPGRLYDGAVAWSDELVGRLVQALRESGALDHTLVVVTSDHGEGLGDHGEDVHGYFVYESTLRVPLIIRGPGVKPGTRLDGVIRTVDLFPTIVEMSGLRGSGPVAGRSLASALRGERLQDEASFAESLVPLLHYGWSDLHTMREGRWKYILAPRPELYDLDRDPGELRNLVDAESARARAMHDALANHLLKQRATAQRGTATAAMPPDLLEKLGTLGYVSVGKPSDAKGAGADPKDKLEDYKALTNLTQQGLVALHAGRAAEAIVRFRAVALRGVDDFLLHYYLGNAHMAQKQWRAAADEYQQALKREPTYGAAWRGLGETRVALGDPLGAAQAFEKLVSMAPDDALGLMELGEMYRDLGRMADATRVMRQAVALDARPAAYWNALGTVLGATGQLADAEQAFAQAMARDSHDANFPFNRGVALERLGRRDDAIAQYRRAAALGFPAARTRLAQLGGGRQ